MSEDGNGGEGGGGRKSGPRKGGGGGKFAGERRPRPADGGGDKRRSFGAKPGKPYAGKRERPGGDAPSGAGGGEGRPARARPEGGKPFTPKSRGMFSHGGARSADSGDGTGGKPRSYGRRNHDDAVGGEKREEGERKARPLGAGRRDARPAEARGRDDAKGGFRRDRSKERTAAEKGPGDKTSRPGRRERAAAGETPRHSDARPPRGEARPDTSQADAAGEAALTMRIARRLARAGVASRRDAEAMIAEGRVSVNGKVLETPALDVGPKDRITIDGEPLPAIERTRLWLFNKPAGLVTTNKDPEGRQTVFDKLPAEMPRVLTIGRLDINTEGLLLLTNDGGLARVLELPATGWLRRYRVRAHGTIDQAKLDELRAGIAIDGVFYGAIEATLDREQGSNVWMTLGLREGKNREVKRVLGHLGLDVNRLIRLSYGPFQLADLAEGAVREIHGKTLRDQLGPRLIEEAGADFDAPIVNPFSNKPVEAPRTPRAKDGEARQPRGETAPNRKRQREEEREDALGKLATRADRPSRGKTEDRPARPGHADRSARPGEPGKSFGGKSFGARSFGEKSFGEKSFGDKPRARGNARDDGPGPRSRPGERGDGREGKRSTGDRPPREGFGDKKFGDRKFGDKKFGDKTFGAGKRDAAADERPSRPPLGAGRRLSNVWIAPGGRPMGPKKAAGEEARAERAERPRSADPTQRMGKRRTGPKPTSGAGGAGGPRRPKKG